MGSPDFAVPALRALHEAGHEIAAVYCQPPRPAGRGQSVRPSPVQAAAEAMGLPVRTPVRLKRDVLEHASFAALDLDACVVAAYGLILPEAMLAAPTRGCLNIHASLLPRWRGAAPIQAAILAGDAETGITIMQMDAGLDTGPMLLREAVPIGPRGTAAEMHDVLASLGARLVLRALEENPPPVAQPEAGAVYAPKLVRADGRIDWSRRCGGARPAGAGAEPLAGHLHPARRRGSEDPGRGTGRRLRHARRGAGRRLAGRRRQLRAAADPGAGPRQGADGGRRLPARAEDPGGDQAGLMPFYALQLEYDGTGFVGWQRQDNGVSIQQVLEEAASHLAGGAPVASIAAGRTDAGVHAVAQVVKISLARDLPPRTVREALNFHMKPHRVVVLQAALVTPNWSPRFDAIGRAYRYRILNRRARAALDAGQVWHVQRPLDVAAMQAGADLLLGRHDFTSFRASACQAKSPIRTLDRLDVRRVGDIVELEVEARSFLHHQVRNFVGTLKLVGDGMWPVSQVADILAARDRSLAGPTAPAAGLCLTRVAYPVDPFDGTVSPDCVVSPVTPQVSGST